MLRPPGADGTLVSFEFKPLTLSSSPTDRVLDGSGDCPWERGNSCVSITGSLRVREIILVIYNKKMTSPELTIRCQELRKNPTPAEALLWKYLRSNQIKGLKFRRQHPIFGFILDFYCKKARLGIELDGNIHLNQEQIDLDNERTRILNENGVAILRFWNSEVIHHIDDVITKINQTLDLRMNHKIPSCLNNVPNPDPHCSHKTPN